MKKIHIIAIVIIIAAIAILLSATKDMGTYATFSEAESSGKIVKLVGELSKDKVIEYNPQVDPNYCSFHIKDADGQEKKVILLMEKPHDFERSEKVVLTGKMKGEEFVATSVLLKCPSKYQDEELFIRAES
ncbi:MAG: cytochrome c maturation protein CcmE [Bacteroidia bacterium]|nr:cytochrome c maturation protein CcmE [Bacteroidia bacterium]